MTHIRVVRADGEIIFQMNRKFFLYLMNEMQDICVFACQDEKRGKIVATQLDSFDIKLLAAVQRDARTPQNELGEAVNLSTAAVNRRLKRLGEESVIERYTAVVSPDALGYGLTIIAMVEVESEQIDQLDAMRRSFVSCRNVQQCYYVAGEWDFVLLFVVQHMEQYNELTRELFFGNPNVKRFKTLVAMSRDKVTLDLPLNTED